MDWEVGLKKEVVDEKLEGHRRKNGTHSQDIHMAQKEVGKKRIKCTQKPKRTSNRI